MERVEIHIKMQMMSQLRDLFERDIKTIAKIDYRVNDVQDMQEKLREKIYSIIEREEEKEVTKNKSVIEPILRQELSNYLSDVVIDEVVYNLSDVIDIYEEKADIKPVEIR